MNFSFSAFIVGLSQSKEKLLNLSLGGGVMHVSGEFAQVMSASLPPH